MEGENGFRDRETFALNQVMAEANDYVLSLGGGCVIRPENRQIITRQKNLVVQLVADLEIIVERLSRSPNKRPLLANQDLKQKLSRFLKSVASFIKWLVMLPLIQLCSNLIK